MQPGDEVIVPANTYIIEEEERKDDFGQFQDDTEIYPGRGEVFGFGEVRAYYEKYITI